VTIVEIIAIPWTTLLRILRWFSAEPKRYAYDLEEWHLGL